eukprot:XP_001710021.1 Hypothetical protein GL50803_34994 [Giardia lamblia ATCC 50803]
MNYRQLQIFGLAGRLVNERGWTSEEAQLKAQNGVFCLARKYCVRESLGLVTLSPQHREPPRQGSDDNLSRVVLGAHQIKDCHCPSIHTLLQGVRPAGNR